MVTSKLCKRGTWRQESLCEQIYSSFLKASSAEPGIWAFSETVPIECRPTTPLFVHGSRVLGSLCILSSFQWNIVLEGFSASGFWSSPLALVHPFTDRPVWLPLQAAPRGQWGAGTPLHLFAQVIFFKAWLPSPHTWVRRRLLRLCWNRLLFFALGSVGAWLMHWGGEVF